jgi:hypothetical protein
MSLFGLKKEFAGDISPEWELKKEVKTNQA